MVKVSCYHWIKTKKKESQSYEHIRLSETGHTSYNVLNYLNFILKECATSTHAKFKKRFSNTKLTRVGKGYLRFSTCDN